VRAPDRRPLPGGLAPRPADAQGRIVSRRVLRRDDPGSSAPPMRTAARRAYARSMVMEAYIRDEHGPVRLDLSDFEGGWTRVALLPPGMASHPELAAFERLRRRFADEDCLVVAASIDSWWQLRDARASFPLVADTHALLASAFGAYEQGDARFGWVLLGPDGAIRESDLEHGPCARCALDALQALRGRPRLRLPRAP